MQIPAVDGLSGSFQDTGKATAFRRVLPVERTHGGDILVEDNARDVASRCSRLYTIPSAQHEGCPMKLKAGQTLLAGPLAGRLAAEEPVEA